MTQLERAHLREARRHLRFAMVAAENHRWDDVVRSAEHIYRQPVGANATTMEVKDLLASMATTDPANLKSNAAMRLATVIRLKHTYDFIGEALVATTDQ